MSGKTKYKKGNFLKILQKGHKKRAIHKPWLGFMYGSYEFGHKKPDVSCPLLR